MRTLHVVDANCSWIRALASGLPHGWRVCNYRIYNPQWLPNGKSDLYRAFRSRKLDDRTVETFVLVPGWNKAPGISALILRTVMGKSLRKSSPASVVLFTFPFYSAVAAWVRTTFPHEPIAYYSHDPFEFYDYPPGYIRMHEDRMIPLCDRVFVIADKLGEDFRERYPTAVVQTLGNAISESFLHASHDMEAPPKMEMIRAMGRPVVGCVGQINKSYDWDLLESAAKGNPQAQYAFVGNLFEEGAITERIRRFFERPNVHWLGPKPHHKLKGYMECCDILLNPLAVNAQNDRRDTLRLYDYLSTKAAVVSTAIDGAKRHGNLVNTISSESEMIAALGRMPSPLSVDEMAQRRAYLAGNTWTARGRQFAEAIHPSN